MSTAPVDNGSTPAKESQDGLNWRKMHPVTPLVRGWGAIFVLIFIAGQQIGDGGMETADQVVSSVGPLIIAGVFAAIILVIGGYSALAWHMMSYSIGTEAVHLRQGIVFRQQRQARLDRLQAVDIVQPLIARLFGLAELRLEVAGGAGSGVRIGFLKLDVANALRNDLLARAAGIEVSEGEAAPEAPERRVIQVEAGMLIWSNIRSGALIFFVLFMALFVAVAIATTSVAPLFTAIPLVFGLGAYLANRFFGEFNFTGAVSADGIRLRRGLLETTSQTIPPGRVQAIRLVQPLLWRSKDWWRVDLNVAGYGNEGDGNKTSSVLLPVGDRGAALDAVWLVFPDLGVADPLGVLDEAMVGSGPSERFITSPRSARWVDPLSWRRNGYTVTGRGLLIRSGRLNRRLILVPHERTQSLGLHQGPIQRRLGLTTFRLDSTPGPVRPVVAHLSNAAAAELLREQDRRARIARGAQGPELWMSRVAPAGAAAPAPDAPPAVSGYDGAAAVEGTAPRHTDPIPQTAITFLPAPTPAPATTPPPATTTAPGTEMPRAEGWLPGEGQP